MATFLCSSRGNALWWWSGLFIFRVLLDHYRNLGGSHCCKTYEKLCSFHNGEWWYCFIQIKRLIVYSTCRWMCAIPVYDYGELKVLLFRLVADGRLQVKINGWDCCLEHLVWSKEFLFCRNLNTSSLMCYSIDCALHRYESSLKNTGDAYFKECLQLMKSNPKHFSLGLKIFKDGRKSSYFRGLV